MGLRLLLDEAFPHFKITMPMFQALIRFCNEYEIRQQHSEALNTALLGVYPIHFYDQDQLTVFNIFGIDRYDFNRVIRSSTSVNTDWVVTSDPFNLFAVWLMYKFHISDLQGTLKDPVHPSEKLTLRDFGKITICKLLHYKFFTSVVKNNLKHGANPNVMAYTIDQLNGKFDIKDDATMTWRLAIEQRARDVVFEDSIHKKRIEVFGPLDVDVFYILSDIQTRLRNKIVKITKRYYVNVELNNQVGTYGNIETIDGEKVLRSLNGMFDVMIDSICNQVLNVNLFLNFDYIKFVSNLSNNISPAMLRGLLVYFSNMAVEQYRKGQAEQIVTQGNNVRLVGYRTLIGNLVQKTYRDCVTSKVNLGSPLEIFAHIKDLYHSSRVKDSDILLVKASVRAHVVDSKVTNREATEASLTIAFVIYIMFLTFDFIK